MSAAARERIAQAQRKRWKRQKRAQRAAMGQTGNPTKKGYAYNGTHWTQRPENKARLRKMMKATRAKVLANEAAA